MKQFNLEEYLANPSRRVVTRDGDNVRIICTDARGDYPIIALAENPYEVRDIIHSYTKEGYFYVSENPCPFDLSFAPEKKKGWVNIYRDLKIDELCCRYIYFLQKKRQKEMPHQMLLQQSK